jgi:CelD/BcsL family acetyltransferase involved in cellulose biosynthesis
VLRLELADPRWLAFVEDSPSALPFHHPAWSQLLADCYGYPGFAFAVVDGAGRVHAGVPIVDVSTRLTSRKWVSLPFTDFCPPLADGPGPLGELIHGLNAERRAAGVARVELRGEVRGFEAVHTSDSVRHRLDLDPDPDAVARGFRTRARRHITKAVRQGVTVRRASGAPEFLRIFYRLHLETRRRLGVPIQPKRFFRMLWERVIERDLGLCLIAFAGEAPAAATVLLAASGHVTYKYSAWDRRFVALRPNHLLLSEAIAWACTNGFREFDFGRSDVDNAGLRSFKSSWGATEEPLVYSYIGDAPHAGRRARAAALLEPVIRHSPSAVCRLAGELLYKYSA